MLTAILLVKGESGTIGYFSGMLSIRHEGAGLPEPLAYGLGIACLVVAAVWFTIWYNKQERNQQ